MCHCSVYEQLTFPWCCSIAAGADGPPAAQHRSARCRAA